MADASPAADAATAPPAPSPPADASPSAVSASASASASASSAPKAKPLPLPAALQPAAIDAFLLRLNKCMETPLGMDAVLAVVCYGARLAAVVLSSGAAGRALLHAPARQLATLVRLPDSTLVLLTAPGAPGASGAPGTSRGSAAAAAAAAAKQLRALGSLMAEARMILRLWGLLSMYPWARLLVRQLLDGTARAQSRTARAMAWTQLLSCLAYQVYENGAYLAQRGVLAWSPAKQARAYRWSSRAFCVYVVVELARLVHDTAAAHRRRAAKDAETVETTELHRSLARYAALAPVMAHYSVEKGFLGDAAQAVLGFIPAALQMHKTWGTV